MELFVIVSYVACRSRAASYRCSAQLLLCMYQVQPLAIPAGGRMCKAALQDNSKLCVPLSLLLLLLLLLL